MENKANSTEVQELKAKIAKLERVHAICYECHKTLMTQSTVDAFFGDMCRIVTDIAGYNMAWIGLVDNNEQKTIKPIAASGNVSNYLTTNIFSWHDPESSAIAKAINTGKIVVQTKSAMGPLWNQDDTERGFRAIAAVPFSMNHKGGVLVAYSTKENIFTDEETGHLTSLAMNISYGHQTIKTKEELNVLASAVQNAAESILITDIHAKVIYTNPCFENLSGYSKHEVLGKHIGIFKSGKHNKDFYEALWHTLKAGNTWHGRFVNRKKDGTLYEEDAIISPVRDASGHVTNYVAVKRDVTQEIALEKQLRHSQKMEAIGRFSRGVAHDFTNLLVIIMNSAEIIKTMLGTSRPDLYELIDNIVKSSRRGGLMTAQLLAFSQNQPTSLKPHNINRVICGLNDMIKRSIGTDIIVDIRTDNTPIKVMLDAAQIEQSIVHICANARDAMPNGGRMTITVSTASLMPEELVLLSGKMSFKTSREPKHFGVITITDTGNGMPEEVMSHIFEPFFTTKNIKMSTGLGLSTTYSIITQHGGYIRVTSNIGIGTTFCIYLPQIEENTISEAQKADQKGITILVIEDDLLLRQITSRILRNAGYTVLESENLAQSLLAIEQNKDDIGLIYSDIFLKDELGSEVTATIRTKYPNIKLIFCSGYPKDILVEKNLIAPGDVLLSKPFRMETLLETVKALLGR